MNKLIISLIVIFVLLTTVISVVKPPLHKPLTFAPQSTVVEDIPQKASDTDVETQIVHVQQTQEEQGIQLTPQQDNIIQQNVKVSQIPQQIVEQKTIFQNTPSQVINKNIKTKAVKSQTQVQQRPKYELPKSIQDIVNGKHPQNQEVEKIVQSPKPPVQQTTHQKSTTPHQQQQVQQKPKPPQVQQKPQQVQNNAPLTEAEEVIVWNKWRSDLQNKVMRDSRIAAPRGTVFRFSFTVNKFGQMSNLKIWSDTPGYTNYAIQALKPLLLSYQGKPILNFPARTKRITTNVEGAFAISNQDRFTTPNDYSDIERVRN